MNKLVENNLIQTFYDFYVEFDECLKMVKTDVWIYKGEKLEESPNFKDQYSWIFNHFLQFFKRQEEEILQSGGQQKLRQYKDVLYVMVSLTDEIFISQDWSGKQRWNQNLLETRLFDSSISGERFFQQLDQLLDKKDLNSIELSNIYLYALSLGFRGKYGWDNNEKKINEYKEQLYYLNYHTKPAIKDKKDKLFAQSYHYQSDKAHIKKMPEIHRWCSVIILIVLSLLSASHFIWSYSTEEIINITNQIIS